MSKILSKNNILYEEKLIAENLYKNGFTEKKYSSREAFLIAKYMRHILEYKDQRIRTELIKYCEKHDSLFNRFIESKKIKEIVNNSKSNFISYLNTYVTENELLSIRKIKNFQAQKLYFSLLLIARRNKSNFVSLSQWSLMKRISGINIPYNKIYKLIHLLYGLGYLEPIIRSHDNGHILKVIDEKNEPPHLIFITDIEIFRARKSYERYCGGKLGYCEICESEFIIKSHRQKYCEIHSKEKKLEKHKKYNKKRE